MNGRFQNKVALVTGAGSGIGRAVALAFGREGAKVVAADINPQDAEASAALIANGGGVAHAIRCDVADEASVASMMARTLERFGTVDCAVNNAGVSHAPAPTMDLTYADWRRVLDVNVVGVWLCMREELRHMTGRRTGTIVNTASFASFRTLKGLSAYVASKHALLGLTKNAAIEYAEQGIRINAVCPGSVATRMFDDNLGEAAKDEKIRAQALKEIGNFHPMGRVAEAEEIADAVLFLSSDAASFVTGGALPVDGGWTAS